jgi:CHAT domain-containing protein
LKRGEIQAAQQETEQALRQYRSEKTEWHWRFRLLKAETLHREGRNAEALALVSPELPSSLANGDLPIRRKLVQGAAYALTQRLPEAFRSLAEAERLARANCPDLMGEIAMRQGTVLFLAGDPSRAEAAYRESLRMARERKDPFLEASSLEGLGVVATKTEHYDQAIDWDRAALEAARSAGAQHSLAQTLGNMAWNYRKLGDFENALALYKQAEEASARSGSIGDQIYWLTGIENVYFEQHDYPSAEAVLEKALAVARGQDDKGTLAEFLNDLSEVALETGRLDLAEKYQTEVAELEMASPDAGEMRESLLIRGRIRESRHDRAAAEKYFQQLISDPATDSSQKWEAQARLAEVFAEESFDARAEKEFRESLDTIETVRSSVEREELRLSFLSTAISFYGNYIDFLIARGRIREALEVAELGRARTLAEGLTSQRRSLPFSGARLHSEQVALQAKAVLLFYWIGEQHSHLWVITPAQVSHFHLPERSKIGNLAKAYRQSILDGQDVLSLPESGTQLYNMLVRPAARLIPANSRVVLIPGESLYGLNFETLIVPEPKPHFWIEDVTIAEAASLTLVSLAGENVAGRDGSLLLIGDPQSHSSDFPPLSQAPVEMQKVLQHFAGRQSTVLQGAQATPSAYLNSNPERFAYVHFVTHGTASETRPLESAVILSSEGDSYKLYARDIVARHLAARLVTISACNGAGTRAYEGEGLVGLSWGFLRAGAHNVIASLWEVSDASSTAQLMDQLYGGLDKGQDPATALRNAKLSLIQSNANGVFRKPYYWAPFLLYVGS